MFHYFTVFIYQPFFNLLVFFYWALDFITRGNGDMGIAVILLTIVIRVILYPLSVAQDKSENDRKNISDKIRQIEVEHRTDPIAFDAAKKQVLHTNKGVLIAEIINLTIQVIVALMLWRIFSKGLSGEDVHLLYGFMPNVEQPFNLVFLGKYDLTHPSLQLNLIQTGLIFILETIMMLGATSPVSKQQFVRLQFLLPIVSFFIFLGLPAGKKLFVITTLIISIILSSIRTVQRRFAAYKEKVEAQEAKKDEQLVVDIK
jgi:YidC/Oxa1 family membrane protein insertase